MIKNIVKMIFAVLFIIVNFMWSLQTENDVRYCNVRMGTQGYARMQCRQKRYDFYINILYTYIALLFGHLLTSSMSLVWTLRMFQMRRITSIIEGLKRRLDTPQDLVEAKGKDFLFLFDLVAQSCGRPATLRVLSHTAPAFAQLCQPSLETVIMTETSIRLTWGPCPLQHLGPSPGVQRYVATLLPAHRHHIKSVVAAQQEHQLEFRDLEGGRREYVVTISAIIGDAKMKGVTTTTCLPPFPPQNLTCIPTEDGMCDGDHRTSIKVRWSRPKGEFDKYILKVTEVGSDVMNGELQDDRCLGLAPPPLSDHNIQTITSGDTSVRLARRDLGEDEVCLASSETQHVKTGLRPGVRYQLELRSLTGECPHADNTSRDLSR